MNKKGESTETNDIIHDNLIYFILIVLTFSGLLYFALNQMNSASVWADFYAKEIVKSINAAQPEDEVTINVHKATEIARKNNVHNFNEIFSFNSAENKVCVKLSLGRKTCYSYFNEVAITDYKIIYGQPVNLLNMKIAEKTK